MSLYKDQEKKIKYYRERITQNLARQGIYPSDERIKSQLDRIDTMLGIFQYINTGVGEEFDTEKFNEDIVRILQDIKILYELAYDITVKDYEELKFWCDIKLAELQSMAARYNYKSGVEFSSTFLGDTVFYQSTDYNIVNKNGIAEVKLGLVEVETQSKLYCLFDCKQVQPKNVIFRFKDKQGIVSNCSIYDYNRDFFTVPGELKKKNYQISLNGEAVRTSFICTPESLSGSVNPNNRYLLFGGSNQVCKGYYAKEFVTKTQDIPIELETGGIATFYIVDGTYANFEFSAEPQNKNFEGNNIINLGHYKKIVIEHNQFLSFDFVTDGKIFATCCEGQVKNNDIIYPSADQISDILIEEYSVGDKVTYEVSVTAGPFLDGNIPVINSIAIKQLSVLEDIL